MKRIKPKVYVAFIFLLHYIYVGYGSCFGKQFNEPKDWEER